MRTWACPNRCVQPRCDPGRFLRVVCPLPRCLVTTSSLQSKCSGLLRFRATRRRSLCAKEKQDDAATNSPTCGRTHLLAHRGRHAAPQRRSTALNHPRRLVRSPLRGRIRDVPRQGGSPPLPRPIVFLASVGTPRASRGVPHRSRSLLSSFPDR